MMTYDEATQEALRVELKRLSHEYTVLGHRINVLQELLDQQQDRHKKVSSRMKAIRTMLVKK